MSLPPQVIRVKRKRTEEGPVPSFLRVEDSKRHRSDAFLYRRQNNEAATARNAGPPAASPAASPLRPPKIHASKPGDEKRKIAKKEPTTAALGVSKKIHASSSESKQKGDELAASLVAAVAAAEPRRFHLSRESLMVAQAARSSILGSNGIRKKARYGGHHTTGVALSETAIFIERSQRRRRRDQARKSRRDEKAHGHAQGTTAQSDLPTAILASSASVFVKETTVLDESAKEDEGASLEAPEVRPLPKRPNRRGPAKATAEPEGEAAKTLASTGTTPATIPPGGETADSKGNKTADAASTAPPALPDSLVHRKWDTEMDQLTRDMNNYTLELLGRNIARMDKESKEAEATRQAMAQRVREAKAATATTPKEPNEPTTPGRRRRSIGEPFKPSPAGVRFAKQRALEHESGAFGQASDDASPKKPAASGMRGDIDMASDSESGSETDEDDYVTETYVRVPGHEVQRAGVAMEGTLGLLVFDSEPDIEYFYGAEEDSEDEFDDDEDENAEDYYMNDYPEDEVSSEDEFDRSAYHYRTGNASDMEEFSDDDEVPEDTGVKFPTV